MQEQQKAAVLQAQQALNDAISVARAAGVTVNLWIVGQGPAGAVVPSTVALDFGNTPE
jgi:hypothetical protein